MALVSATQVASGQVSSSVVFSIDREDKASRIVAFGASFPSTLDVSPNGKEIAYVRDADIWVASPDGTVARPLFRSADAEHSPQWSPDGDSIAFIRNRHEPDLINPHVDLYLVAPNGTNLRLVERDADHPAWSPDGRWLAYESRVNTMDKSVPGDASALRIAFRGPRARKPFVAPRDYSYGNPAWISATSIGFVRTGHGKRLGKNDIVRAILTTRALTPVVSGPVGLAWPRWSPNGRYLTFSQPKGIFLRDERTKRVRRVTGALDAPWTQRSVWSPDSRHIAYHRNNRLWVLDLGRVGGRPLARGLSPWTVPSWSPDSRRVFDAQAQTANPGGARQ